MTATSATSAAMPCPVTGAPPVRLVQQVDAQLLQDLWRIEFGVDVRSSFRGVRRFNLWESPTGLFYFDPPREGDARFYSAYYDCLGRKGYYRPGSVHAAMRLAAADIDQGERVLDVGCGYGELRHLLPQADYTGLDPHFAGAAAWIRAESLDTHLQTMAGRYDAAFLFEVLEHLSDPAHQMRQLARAVRRGGRVYVSVPCRPCAMTRIPNYLHNAPPHHLTWWTEAALRAVAEQAGLAVERIVHAPWCEVSALNYWIARCSPVHTRDVYYRHSWLWHAGTAIGMALGVTMNRIVGVPRNAQDEGAGLLLAARRT